MEAIDPQALERNIRAEVRRHKEAGFHVPELNWADKTEAGVLWSYGHQRATVGEKSQRFLIRRRPPAARHYRQRPPNEEATRRPYQRGQHQRPTPRPEPGPHRQPPAIDC